MTDTKIKPIGYLDEDNCYCSRLTNLARLRAIYDEAALDAARRDESAVLREAVENARALIGVTAELRAELASTQRKLAIATEALEQVYFAAKVESLSKRWPDTMFDCEEAIAKIKETT